MFNSSAPQLGYLPGDGLGGFGSMVSIFSPVDPSSCNGVTCTQMQVCSNNTCVTNCNFNPMACNQATGACNGGTGLCMCGNGPGCQAGQYCVNGTCGTTPPCSI